MQQEINKDSIVLLPQKHTGWNKGDIIKRDDISAIAPYDSLIDSMRRVEKWQAQYMYITTPAMDSVPVDEWYIDETKMLRQSLTSDKNYWKARKHYKRVIGSNNPTLIAHSVPGISDEFIRQWVDVQGKEYKVMMGTETKGICCTPMEGIRHHGTYCLTCDGYKEAQFPKLSNNQLVLSVVEEKQDNITTQLTEHLKNTPKEQLQKEWAEIEAMGFEGPTVAEFIGNQKAHSIEDSDIEAAAKEFTKHSGWDDSIQQEPSIEGFKAGIEWYKSQQQQEAKWTNEDMKLYVQFAIDWKGGHSTIANLPSPEKWKQEWLKTQ